MPDLTPGFERFLVSIAVLAAIALVVAVVLLMLLMRRLRRLRLPPDADLWDTVRVVPLGLVVALDLLDLSLDVLSAPVAWWLLGKLRLSGLRQVATVQALVPFTGPIPVLTVAWVAARTLGLGRPPAPPGTLEGREVAPGRWEAGPPG